jgi:hypothetical protein
MPKNNIMIKEQCDLGAIPVGNIEVVAAPEVVMNSLEALMPPAPHEIMAAYIGFTRAFHLWFHGAHNLAKGTGFAGDHVNLYRKIYLEVQATVDGTIEKAVGIFVDEELACPIRITSDALLILENWESPAGQPAQRIADVALEYAEQLVKLDERVAEELSVLDALTYGLDNHLADLADIHEGYVYLLRQRVKNL